MKYILTLMMFYSLASYSQYAADYSIHSTWTFRHLTIYPNGSFKFSYFDCTSFEIGMGWYETTPAKLKLHFVKDTTILHHDTSDIQIEKLSPASNDFCKIELKLIDIKDTQGVIGATIYDTIGNTGTVTDIDGNALLKIYKGKANCCLKLNYLLPIRDKICLTTDIDYRIKVFCDIDNITQKKIPPGTIYTWKISHKTRKGFDIRYNKKFEKYSRTAIK